MEELVLPKMKPFSTNGVITETDTSTAITTIDGLIAKGLTASPEYPSIQTERTLFDMPEFAKFKETFDSGCRELLDPSFFSLQTRCWAYVDWFSNRGGRESRQQWHTHKESVLSGIFYLQVPDKAITYYAGTEFQNNDGSIEWQQPVYGAWWIFPSNRLHRPGKIVSDNKRYVLAAEAIATLAEG